MAELNQTEKDRLTTLQQKPQNQQTDAEKKELAALLHKRDHE